MNPFNLGRKHKLQTDTDDFASTSSYNDKENAERAKSKNLPRKRKKVCFSKIITECSSKENIPLKPDADQAITENTKDHGEHNFHRASKPIKSILKKTRKNKDKLKEDYKAHAHKIKTAAVDLERCVQVSRKHAKLSAFNKRRDLLKDSYRDCDTLEECDDFESNRFESDRTKMLNRNHRNVVDCHVIPFKSVSMGNVISPKMSHEHQSCILNVRKISDASMPLCTSLFTEESDQEVDKELEGITSFKKGGLLLTKSESNIFRSSSTTNTKSSEVNKLTRMISCLDFTRGESDEDMCSTSCKRAKSLGMVRLVPNNTGDDTDEEDDYFPMDDKGVTQESNNIPKTSKDTADFFNICLRENTTHKSLCQSENNVDICYPGSDISKTLKTRNEIRLTLIHNLKRNCIININEECEVDRTEASDGNSEEDLSNSTLDNHKDDKDNIKLGYNETETNKMCTATERSITPKCDHLANKSSKTTLKNNVQPSRPIVKNIGDSKRNMIAQSSTVTHNIKADASKNADSPKSKVVFEIEDLLKHPASFGVKLSKMSKDISAYPCVLKTKRSSFINVKTDDLSQQRALDKCQSDNNPNAQNRVHIFPSPTENVPGTSRTMHSQIEDRPGSPNNPLSSIFGINRGIKRKYGEAMSDTDSCSNCLALTCKCNNIFPLKKRRRENRRPLFNRKLLYKYTSMGRRKRGKKHIPGVDKQPRKYTRRAKCVPEVEKTEELSSEECEDLNTCDEIIGLLKKL